MTDPNDDPIELTKSQYDQWSDEFRAEEDRIRDTLRSYGLSDYLDRIEHIGSTAVPHLAAKALIDLDIIVADGAVTNVSRALETDLGGTRLENTDRWHPLFRTHDGQRFNDHVFALSSDRWKISVITRDVLRARSDLRTEYEQLKYDLAAETDDLTVYSRGKSEFIARLLRIAREEQAFSFGFEIPE